MSYKAKTFICLVIILLSGIILLYAANDFPPLSPESAFRRLEKQHLLGPAEILDTLQIRQLVSDRIMIAKSEYGYSLYQWDSQEDYDNSLFIYRPKTEDITIFRPSYFDRLCYLEGWQLPYFVFTDHASATTATFTLELTHASEKSVITLEAGRQNSGYFLFILCQEVMDTKTFQAFDSAISDHASSNTAVVHITLYDRAGTEVARKTVDLTYQSTQEENRSGG